ncbi:MAG: metallophosphoesterase [Bacteroidales bacterium]|nr:metallophosphoesterase [Bacteroidales bacterium]
MGEGNNLPSILKAAVSQSGICPGVVLLGGDYVGGGKVMTPEFPISDLYSEVYSVLDAPTCDALFTYGSHDACCTDGYSAFFSGPRRCDGYYVYGITYVQVACATDEDASAAVSLHNSLLRSGEDFSDFDDDDILLEKSGYGGIDIVDRFGKSAESASASFLKWVESLDDNAPIVVMSHMPLHYNRGDNYGGQIWYEALSKAALSHDILFLWGHNHTIEEKAADYSDKDDVKLADRFKYLLTPSDFLTPGDTMEIQGASKEETISARLNFSYANAGYIKLGYGTMITFSGDSSSYSAMTLHRYAADTVEKETEIGFTGKPNPYTVRLTKGA